jgi:hypothetical protein
MLRKCSIVGSLSVLNQKNWLPHLSNTQNDLESFDGSIARARKANRFHLSYPVQVHAYEFQQGGLSHSRTTRIGDPNRKSDLDEGFDISSSQ